MRNILALVCGLIICIASPTFAGGLTAAQQDALTQMAITVLGPPPSDGTYHGASITHSVSQMPAGRSDCVPIDSKGNIVQGVNRGTWQRWKCGPGLGSGSGGGQVVGEWSAWGPQPNGRSDCRPADRNHKLFPSGTSPKPRGQFTWACPH